MTDRKIAVITGSTGGIGSAIATKLAEGGWDLLLANRSLAKSAEQRDMLASRFPEPNVQTVAMDLMDINSIEAACRQIGAETKRIDALYNMAGVLTSERRISVQGYESHYAVNVLANLAVIEGLQPLLAREPNEQPSMVVTMSSSAISRVAALDVKALRDPSEIRGLMGAYAHSKLALTAISAAMSDSLKKEGILIRAIDPGATLTPMTSGGDGMPLLLRWFAPLFFSKPEVQAKKIVAAADPDNLGNRTGIYIASGKEKSLPKAIADLAVGDELLKALRADLHSLG